MPLSPGDEFGPYLLIAPISRGGMGEVWKARDTRLDRIVAMKFSEEKFSERFEREVKAISSLNHPNICTLYDVGPNYLVMEYIEGTPITPVDTPRKLLDIAVQISDGLATAHAAGFVHRDLKPDNILITRAGRVKLLDFGLAKAAHEDIAPGDATRTVTVNLTDPGTTVGTIAYMSPEQARGLTNLAAQSDQFSLGLVLYELAAGTRAFQRGSKAETMTAIIRDDVEPVPASVPAPLRWVIERLLAKEPAERYDSTRDLYRELKQIRERLSEGSASVPQASSAVFHPRWRVSAIAALAAVSGAVLSVAGMRLMQRRPPDTSLVQAITMLTTETGLSAYPALSRDGSLVAFASDRVGENNLDIWIQQIGGREPIRLTRDEADETDPAISPDGTKVAFRSERNGGGVYVVPALGGEPILVAPGGRNPRFSPDGRTIAYWTGRTSIGGFVPGSAGVFLVEAGGGLARPFSTGMAVAMYPVWSPTGEELLVLGRKDSTGQPMDSVDWWILPAAGGAPRRTGVFAQFSAARLKYLSGQAGFQPLEWLSNAELIGQASGSRVLFGATLGESGNLWEVGLTSAGAADGLLKRVTLGPGRQAQASEVAVKGGPRIVFADLSLRYDVWTAPVNKKKNGGGAEVTRLTDSLSEKRTPSVSADGNQIAYVRRQIPNWSLRVRDLTTKNERLLVSSEHRIVSSRMSGDGTAIAYSDESETAFSVPSAGGAVERLFDGCGAVTDSSFDGRRILYEPIEDENLTMFERGPDASTGRKVILARRPAGTVLSGARFSPDGKWVAFHSIDRSSKVQLWITRIDGALPVPPAEWIAVTDGKYVERDPAWAPSGALLYYLSEADGFRCIWARRLDPSSKRPLSEAFPVEHFHSVGRSLAPFGTAGLLIGLSVGADKMIFALTELKGNIWLQEATR